MLSARPPISRQQSEDTASEYSEPPPTPLDEGSILFHDTKFASLCNQTPLTDDLKPREQHEALYDARCSRRSPLEDASKKQSDSGDQHIPSSRTCSPLRQESKPRYRRSSFQTLLSTFGGGKSGTKKLDGDNKKRNLVAESRLSASVIHSGDLLYLLKDTGTWYPCEATLRAHGITLQGSSDSSRHWYIPLRENVSVRAIDVGDTPETALARRPPSYREHDLSVLELSAENGRVLGHFAATPDTRDEWVQHIGQSQFLMSSLDESSAANHVARRSFTQDLRPQAERELPPIPPPSHESRSIQSSRSPIAAVNTQAKLTGQAQAFRAETGALDSKDLTIHELSVGKTTAEKKATISDHIVHPSVPPKTHKNGRQPASDTCFGSSSASTNKDDRILPPTPQRVGFLQALDTSLGDRPNQGTELQQRLELLASEISAKLASTACMDQSALDGIRQVLTALVTTATRIEVKTAETGHGWRKNEGVLDYVKQDLGHVRQDVHRLSERQKALEAEIRSKFDKVLGCVKASQLKEPRASEPLERLRQQVEGLQRDQRAGFEAIKKQVQGEQMKFIDGMKEAVAIDSQGQLALFRKDISQEWGGMLQELKQQYDEHAGLVKQVISRQEQHAGIAQQLLKQQDDQFRFMQHVIKQHDEQIWLVQQQSQQQLAELRAIIGHGRRDEIPASIYHATTALQHGTYASAASESQAVPASASMHFNQIPAATAQPSTTARILPGSQAAPMHHAHTAMRMHVQPVPTAATHHQSTMHAAPSMQAPPMSHPQPTPYVPFPLSLASPLGTQTPVFHQNPAFGPRAAGHPIVHAQAPSASQPLPSER